MNFNPFNQINQSFADQARQAYQEAQWQDEQNALMAHYRSMNNQQAYQQQYQTMNNQLSNWKPFQEGERYKWMWNGRGCSIEEFAELAFGDTPEATAFLLKHKGIDE